MPSQQFYNFSFGGPLAPYGIEHVTEVAQLLRSKGCDFVRCGVAANQSEFYGYAHSPRKVSVSWFKSNMANFRNVVGLKGSASARERNKTADSVVALGLPPIPGSRSDVHKRRLGDLLESEGAKTLEDGTEFDSIIGSLSWLRPHHHGDVHKILKAKLPHLYPNSAEMEKRPRIANDIGEKPLAVVATTQSAKTATTENKTPFATSSAERAIATLPKITVPDLDEFRGSISILGEKSSHRPCTNRQPFKICGPWGVNVFLCILDDITIIAPTALDSSLNETVKQLRHGTWGKAQYELYTFVSKVEPTIRQVTEQFTVFTCVRCALHEQIRVPVECVCDKCGVYECESLARISANAGMMMLRRKGKTKVSMGEIVQAGLEHGVALTACHHVGRFARMSDPAGSRMLFVHFYDLSTQPTLDACDQTTVSAFACGQRVYKLHAVVHIKGDPEECVLQTRCRNGSFQWRSVQLKGDTGSRMPILELPTFELHFLVYVADDLAAST